MIELDTLPLVKKPAIEVAREYYEQWSLTGDSFNRELVEYLHHAHVFVRPDLFMMAKIIDLGNGPAWYVRMAVGSLTELFLTFPVYLPTICFTRHGDIRLRTYSMKRLARLATARQKEK